MRKGRRHHRTARPTAGAATAPAPGDGRRDRPARLRHRDGRQAGPGGEGRPPAVDAEAAEDRRGAPDGGDGRW